MVRIPHLKAVSDSNVVDGFGLRIAQHIHVRLIKSNGDEVRFFHLALLALFTLWLSAGPSLRLPLFDIAPLH